MRSELSIGRMVWIVIEAAFYLHLTVEMSSDTDDNSLEGSSGKCSLGAFPPILGASLEAVADAIDARRFLGNTTSRPENIEPISNAEPLRLQKCIGNEP